MKHKIEIAVIEAVCFILYYSGLVALCRRFFPRRAVVILFFHQVSARRFESCMRYLAKHYRVISLADYLELYRNKKCIETNTVVVTFDDGYESNYVENLPVLKKHGICATGFLTAALINTDAMLWWDKVTYAVGHSGKDFLRVGNRQLDLSSKVKRGKAVTWLLLMLNEVDHAEQQRMIEEIVRQLEVGLESAPSEKRLMNWQQVREMNAANVEFGAHTLTHPILTRIPIEQAREEICRSKQIVAEQLGKDVRFFAYPNGQRGDFNESVKNIVRQAGFDCALTTIHGTAGVDCDLFALPRIPFTANVTRALFAVTVCGITGRLRIQY